jgi:hypothetical protein
VDIDLSDYRGQTVFVKFSDSIPDTGWGALLRQARLEADGRTLAAFFTGSPAEPLFLHTNHRSRLNANGERFADRDAFFVYRFPLPQARAITLRLELAQEWRLDISTQPPYREHLVAPTRPDLPAIRLRDDEVITRYQTPDAEPFYTYEGAPVGVSLRAGRGGVVLLGVSGRAFGNAYGGARDWRAIVRYVCGLAGVRYRERARIVARRGEWVAAYGTYRTTTLRGTYLDALDPRLPILTDPPLNPRTPRLLLQVDNRLRNGGLLHTNAQVLLRREGGRTVGVPRARTRRRKRRRAVQPARAAGARQPDRHAGQPAAPQRRARRRHAARALEPQPRRAGADHSLSAGTLFTR